MWTKLDDGTIVAEDGKVIFFSAERFVRDICLGSCCFLCGASPQEKPFNKEHVLPDWLLHRFDLHAASITLSNDQKYFYGRFTIPCCQECNSILGERLEIPISRAVKKGTAAVLSLVEEDGGQLLYTWLALIFLKTHIKNREFRWHLDARKGSEKISDFHIWEDLHHIHCLVRAYFTGATIETEAVGSFLTLMVRQETSQNHFDFADLTHAQTMMLRMDEIAFVAVFIDSGAVLNVFQPTLNRIGNSVSELQLREIFSEFAFLNIHLSERTIFRSELNLKAEEHRIVAERPTQIELLPLDLKMRGDILERSLAHALPKISFVGYSKDEIADAIRAGTFTFLFDDNGDFIEKSMIESEGITPLD